MIAVEGGLGVVRLVNARDGKELARLEGPVETRLYPQCFTPDGGELVTVGIESKQIHVFDLRAIRAQLVELGLDWDSPPLPPASPRQPPPSFEVVGADLAADPLKLAQHEKARTVASLYFNPFDADAHRRLGRVLLDQGRLEDAVAHLTAALAFRPDLEAAFYPRGLALYRLKRVGRRRR